MEKFSYNIIAVDLLSIIFTWPLHWVFWKQQ